MFEWILITGAVYKESHEQWKALVVDEFQDTSAMQYRLLKMLASHKCVTIIGDDDQVGGFCPCMDSAIW